MIGANGPIWMPQALKILCLAEVVRISLFHFQPSPLLGNKRLALPSIKVKVGEFQNKVGSTGCKWSSLNAQGIQTPWSDQKWGLFWKVKLGLPNLTWPILTFQNKQNMIGEYGCKWFNLILSVIKPYWRTNLNTYCSMWDRLEIGH